MTVSLNSTSKHPTRGLPRICYPQVSILVNFLPVQHGLDDGSIGNFYSRYLFPFKWNHTAQQDEKIRGALDFSRALDALFLSIYKPTLAQDTPGQSVCLYFAASGLARRK